MRQQAQVSRPQERVAQENLQVVGFHVGEEEYAIDILSVVGVERFEDILRFPQMPEFVEGVKRIRREIVPLVKLRTRFGFPDRENDGETRIIVVEIEGHNVGLIVDAVTIVRRLSWSDVETAPQMALTVESHFVEGVIHLGERMIVLLGPQAVLLDEEAAQLAEAKSRALALESAAHDVSEESEEITAPA